MAGSGSGSDDGMRWDDNIGRDDTSFALLDFVTTLLDYFVCTPLLTQSVGGLVGNEASDRIVGRKKATKRAAKARRPSANRV